MGLKSMRMAPAFLAVAAALAATALSQAQTSAQRPEQGVFSRNWKGMLVDLSCGKGSADRSETPHSPPPFGPSIPHLTLTDWRGCPATAQSSEFGLVFYSGRAVRLDQAGNTRMANELRHKRKWLEEKGPLLLKISGTLYGENLQVESVKKVKELR
jgi:hypothetical protein